MKNYKSRHPHHITIDNRFTYSIQIKNAVTQRCVQKQRVKFFKPFYSFHSLLTVCKLIEQTIVALASTRKREIYSPRDQFQFLPLGRINLPALQYDACLCKCFLIVVSCSFYSLFESTDRMVSGSDASVISDIKTVVYIQKELKSNGQVFYRATMQRRFFVSLKTRWV